MSFDAPMALKACRGRTQAMITYLLQQDTATQAIIDRVCCRLSLRKSDLQLAGNQLYSMLSQSAHGVRSTAASGKLVIDLAHFGSLESAAMGVIMERCLLGYVVMSGTDEVHPSPFKP